LPDAVVTSPPITGEVNVLFVSVKVFAARQIDAVSLKFVLAIVIAEEPSNACPAILTDAARAVAVAALSVVEPEVPEQLPVTFPVNVPAIAPVPVMVGLVKVLFVQV